MITDLIERTMTMNGVVGARTAAPVVILSLAAVATFDVLTSERVGLIPLYMILQLLASWYGGFRFGLLFTLMILTVLVLVGLYGGHPYPSDLYFLINTFGVVSCFVPTAMITARLRQAMEQQRELARTDRLTQIANRTRFVDTLAHEVARQRRTRRPFAVAFIDCDDFKSVNDRFGHATGDEVLRAVAVTLTESLRGTDLPARLGGDEFVVLLTEINPRETLRIAERLRHRLLAAMLARDLPVTFSIGLAVFQNPPEAAEDVIALADGLMYRAKTAGKGQILRELY